jgi:D-arabinose 1-dehydrogenase-like Zn-dependent alcohol dehydrogenase
MSPSIPKIMKAAVCEAPGKGLTVKEIPVPEPQSGEVLIKVHACGVCHSDSAAMSGALGDQYVD